MKLFEPDVETKKATFALGCFWGCDGHYGVTPGVIRTKVGYTGGTKENPTYRDLGDHTEAIEVEFDPTVTNFEKLLVVFWKTHDPSSKNKTQYKSAIYYHNDEQKNIAESQLKEIQSKTTKTIVTEIHQAGIFYAAELYHQKYVLQNHPKLFESLGIKVSDVITSHVACRLNGYVGRCGTTEDFNKEWAKLGINEEQADYVRKEIVSGDGPVCH